MPSSSDVRRPFLVERAHRENFGSSELQLCTLKGNVVFGGRKEGGDGEGGREGREGGGGGGG